MNFLCVHDLKPAYTGALHWSSADYTGWRAAFTSESQLDRDVVLLIGAIVACLEVRCTRRSIFCMFQAKQYFQNSILRQG